MTMTDSLKARYTEVKERIARAAAKSGRDPASIVLVAVSKYAGLDQIRELLAMGHRDFGENQVQQLVHRAAMVEEALRRASGAAAPARGAARTALRPGAAAELAAADTTGPGSSATGPRWHMIGHLQRNKARKAVELCRLIHSVDSLRLAEEIQGVALRLDATVDVLVQVNASGERSKFGCALPAAPHLAEQIDTMAHVRVRGLMTMAPYGTDPEAARPTFERTRELFEDMVRAGAAPAHFNILSMGMSGDFEVAISEGANMVRVGSAIFGPPVAGPSDQPADEPESRDDDDPL